MVMARSLVVARVLALILLGRNLREAESIVANPNPVFDFDGGGGDSLPPVYIRGDETYHWYEDERGYTIIEEPGYGRRSGTNRTQKRHVYANVDPESGDLVSTGVRLGSSESEVDGLGLKKHVRPMPGVRKAKCGRYCEEDPNRDRVRGPSADEGPDRRDPRERANRRRLMSSANALRNLVVLIRFSDHRDRTLPSAGEFDTLLNGPGGEGTVAPTGSVNDVFLSNSYGAFSLESTIYPWVNVSKSEAYYADSQSGLGPKIFEAIREALDVIDSDADFDLSEFNTDFDRGDPFIDAITVIHSGYGAEFGGSDCHGSPESDRVWSHSWFMHTGAWTSSDGTVSVMNYHINPGLWGVCGSEISRIGVIAHETSHFLGLPDLYDPDGGSGIGIYCLMSNSWGVDGSQLYPPMLSPWAKIELGWLTPTILGTSGDFELMQSWQHSEVYKIELGYQPQEYLLIENRQPGSFDSLLNLGGLAIWHIDESMNFYSNSLEGYPGQSNWPANGNHYHVALLQADGRYDLERGRNGGDYSDLFRFDYYFGVDHLFPSQSDPMLGPFPNTDSYKQGVLMRTNHFISGISTTGPKMQFSFLPSSPCQPDEVHFKLLLLTDGKGGQVSWTLAETYSGQAILSGDGYENYACLPARCYTFVIDSGHLGYGVRLDGLKVASGDRFGGKEEKDLRCIIPPTSSPTSAPIKPTSPPSEMPSMPPSGSASSFKSEMPSIPPSGSASSFNGSNKPSSFLSDDCERGNGLLEIIIEGDDFFEGWNWSVEDLFGNIILPKSGQNCSQSGITTIQECILLNSCYTFSIHGSMEDDFANDDDFLRLYTVKMDGEVIASGNGFQGNQTAMFGASCLQNGDAACTPAESSHPMSMFRLELATENERNVTWSLVDGSKQVVRSAELFGNCNIQTLATCLPSQDCYEFTVADTIGHGVHDKGQCTVMFSHLGDMIQNYTGPVLDMHRVYLGTCYSRNFDVA